MGGIIKTFLVICAILVALPGIAFSTPVPDTGQTKCYDNTQEITCPSPGEDFYGQDAQYGPNLQSLTKLDENGNDLPDEAAEWVMVRDNVTGLIWESKTDDGSIHDKDNTYTWERAMEFGTTLNTEQFGGYSDWRLPMVKELSSLVDSSISWPGPAIDTVYFPNTVSHYYVSSTNYAGNYPYVWYIYFSYGRVDYLSMYYNFYVRAVRGEQSGSFGHFIDNNDGTITNTDTGLMWQKTTAPGTYTWQQALDYCENLSLAGYHDWRLPNRNELQSIVDYNTYHVDYLAIDPIFNCVGSYYWSSTTYAGSPSTAWHVYFRGGYVDASNKSNGYYVRAVRGGQCGLFGDSDGDTICNNVDSCPDTPNSNQLDNYPPQGNGIGDACDCEGNFNCAVDQDVDGSDASTFKADFGRSILNRRCVTADTCNGDFSCDGDVDGTDASLFKSDFGRSSLQNPCPTCVNTEPWCQYQ